MKILKVTVFNSASAEATVLLSLVQVLRSACWKIRYPLTTTHILWGG